VADRLTVGTLVDTNVLLDVLTEDRNWLSWSLESLAAVAEDGPLFINPIIYAEVSVRFSRVEDLDEALPPKDYRRRPLPWDAAFLAGKVFLQYRRNSGTRSSTLPDFFIGAHAAVQGLGLLTRDASRYRTYFPTVRLIAPPTVRARSSRRSRPGD
jgi:predicted nucleic acid-binding protein